MNQEWCICKENPCRCFHGWGTHFRSNGELLAAIDAEIERALRDSGSRMVIARHQELEEVEWAMRDGLAESVADLRADGLTIGEIADELGIPEWRVDRVLKRMKRKKRNRRARQDEW